MRRFFVLEHFHEGNLTYRVPGMEEKVSAAYVAVSPNLARERGLEEGDLVRLTSRRGSLKTSVVVSSAVHDGHVFVPVCSSDERVNILTSSMSDPAVHTPAYKEATVKLEKLGTGGPSPLPRTNPRHGQPTPQDGAAKVGARGLPNAAARAARRRQDLMAQPIKYRPHAQTHESARDQLDEVVQALADSGFSPPPARRSPRSGERTFLARIPRMHWPVPSCALIYRE